MPELSRFYGLVITMYRDEHLPPHFHVRYAEWRASFTISPIGVFKGRLPRRAGSIVVEWAALHQEELLENWELAQTGQAPKRIQPLD